MRLFFTDMISAAASIGITAACVAMAAPAAAAIPTDAARQATVRIGDLDLATPAGRATADRRIRAAASRVCKVDDHGLRTDTACMADAIASAKIVHGLGARVASR